MIVEVDDFKIKVSVVYKPLNKKIYLRFKGDVLTITSFKRLSEYETTKLIYDNKKSILALLGKVEKNVESNMIHYLGESYKIIIKESMMNRISFKDDSMVIETRFKNEDYIKSLIKKFYLVNMEKYIENNFDRIFAEFKDLNINRPKIKYKYANTFFGKCYPRKNEITFSGISMKLEPKYIDVVIYHELCHMKYLGHQKDFYDYFESKLEKAKKLQKEFKSLKYNDYC